MKNLLSTITIMMIAFYLAGCGATSNQKTASSESGLEQPIEITCLLQVEKDGPVFIDQTSIPIHTTQERTTTEVEWRDLQFRATLLRNSAAGRKIGMSLLISIYLASADQQLVSDTYALDEDQTFENIYRDNFTGRQRVPYPSVKPSYLTYECGVVEKAQ